MKKCLKLSVLPLLLSVVLLASCKDDDNVGNPNPITKATVENADVKLDQANKRIDILFSEYNTLSAVKVKFEFADGAFLYTPMMMNPATLDLSNEKNGSTIVVQSGKDLIYYDVYGAVDYPLMNIVAMADNDQITGRVVINQNEKVVTIEFNNVVDVTKIKCQITVSPEGGELISPTTNPCVVDLTTAKTIVAKSTRGGTVEYTVNPVQSADVSIAPDGWSRIFNHTLPSHMALYKTNDLYENEAYALVTDKRVKFSVQSNGFKNLTTMPAFYAQDPTAVAMINGSATDKMIVVEGQVVNQGTEGRSVGYGISKYGTVLIGKDWNVTWDKVKLGDTVAYQAMYARSVLINKNTIQSGLNAKDKYACSAIGVTEFGYTVFLVCSQYASQGITIAQEAEIMKEWKCYNAVDLEGGSGVGLLINGQRTIYSSKIDSESGLSDKDYFKPLGCVGVLK